MSTPPPYYCSICERKHVRGKIYDEHKDKQGHDIPRPPYMVNKDGCPITAPDGSGCPGSKGCDGICCDWLGSYLDCSWYKRKTGTVTKDFVGVGLETLHEQQRVQDMLVNYPPQNRYESHQPPPKPSIKERILRALRRGYKEGDYKKQG